MTVDSAIRTYLLTLTAVTAIAGTRISTLSFGHNPTFPAVRVTDISDRSNHHLRGGGGTWRKRVQVDAAAGPESDDPKGVAAQLAAAIRGDFTGGQPTGLLGFIGTMGGVEITGITLAGVDQTYEPDELQQVMVSVDYFVYGKGLLG